MKRNLPVLRGCHSSHKFLKMLENNFVIKKILSARMLPHHLKLRENSDDHPVLIHLF